MCGVFRFENGKVMALVGLSRFGQFEEWFPPPHVHYLDAITWAKGWMRRMLYISLLVHNRICCSFKLEPHVSKNAFVSITAVLSSGKTDWNLIKKFVTLESGNRRRLYVWVGARNSRCKNGEIAFIHPIIWSPHCYCIHASDAPSPVMVIKYFLCIDTSIALLSGRFASCS